MELSQLRAFVEITRTGSFTQAAEALNLAQPSVSARIAALETELGGALFERGGRTVRLTTLGATFLPHAERTLAALHDGLEAVGAAAHGQRGRVAIAALDTLALALLPEPMQRFRAAYPAVDFTVRFRIPPEVIEMLYRGDVTLGLTGAPIWDKGVRIVAHFREQIRAVSAPTHPLALRQQTGEILIVADLYQHTLYRVTQSPAATALVESIAEGARAGSGGALIFLPALMAIPLLIGGRGVAFLAETLVRPYVANHALVYLDFADVPPLHNEPVLITLAHRQLSTADLAFVDIMRASWPDLLIGE